MGVAEAAACEWCGGPLPDLAAAACQTCGAAIAGSLILDIAGVTAIDPAAYRRGRVATLEASFEWHALTWIPRFTYELMRAPYYFSRR